MSDQGRERATLAGMEGSGYGVVESLASLGKGRRLTGLFRTGPQHGSPLREVLAGRRRVPFAGVVHFRHHSLHAELEVELSRVEEEAGALLVEFTAHDVPYGLG